MKIANKHTSNNKVRMHNAVEANGVEANGVEANGVEANAVEANAVEANGVEANAVEANAVASTRTLHKVELFWEAQTLNRKPGLNQLQRYEARHAPNYIKKFIAIGGGPRMGTVLEQYARFHFSVLRKRSKGKEETGYDHILNTSLKPSELIYVEQKSSGHWTDTGYKWQHIELNHKWHMLLLCGIDYEDVKFWGMNRATFMRLVDEKKITNQGAQSGKSSEGMWFNSADVFDVLVPLTSDDDLLVFARTL